MLKIKYKEFMSFGFQQAFGKVSQASYSPKIAYGIKRFGDALRTQQKKIQDDYAAFVKTYAKKDEDGKYIHPEGNETQFDIPDDKMEEYKKEEVSFGEREFEIDRYKMPGFWLDTLTLTPAETASLEIIFDFEFSLDSGHAESNVKAFPARA